MLTEKGKKEYEWEIKEEPEDSSFSASTPEPEVVAEVKKEIQALGDNHKKNYEELQKSYNQLKDVLKKRGDEIDSETKEQITKFSEEITTRQEALDKKADEQKELADKMVQRVDELETVMRRSPMGEGDAQVDVEEEREAKVFMVSAMAARDKEEKGATYQRVKAIVVNLDEFRAYKKSFEEFIRRDERFLGPDTLKALSVGSDPDGGYTVTPALSSRVVKRLFESDPLRQLASIETITTGAIEWMVDWGQAGYGWEGETETGGVTDTAEWRKKRIPVHVMYAKPRATQTLLEDSGINIENWIADKVSSRFLRAEGAAFVAGDGVGRPRGFLDYPTGTNWGQVEQVNMGVAAALSADGFIAVKYSLIEDYLTRGTWLMNRLTVADAMYLKDGMGNYIWKPGLTEDQNSTLVGLPVRMSTTMPVVAANALSVAIADWAEAYIIIDRLGVTVQRDPFTAKPFVEFYTRKRVGGDVTNFQAIKIGKVAV